MGSYEEFIKKLPRISIDCEESFVIEIKSDDIIMAEVVCYIESITYKKGRANQYKVTLHSPKDFCSLNKSSFNFEAQDI